MKRTFFVLLGFILLQSAFAQPKSGLDIDKLTQKVSALPTATASESLKKATLLLAIEQASNCFEANLPDRANELLADVQQALPLPIGKEKIDPATLKFLPPLKVTKGNPHLNAIYAWAKGQIDKPDIPWKKSTPLFNVFKGTDKDYGTREEAIKMGTLFWLVAHPQSEYRNNPELFIRLMRRAHAYIDAYDVRTTAYKDNLNDFFAFGPALYAWLAIDQVWPDLILPSQRAQWNRVITKARDFWLKTYNEGKLDLRYPMGKYANRDLGFANILLNVGLLTKDQTCLDAAKFLIDSQEANLYPDGGWAYIGTQNESCGYHDADVTLLTRYYLVTGYDKCREMLARSQWYAVLSLEPAMVADYWTAPSWKHTWNGSVSTGMEVVASLSGNPYLRWLIDKKIAGKKEGGNVDPLEAMFYRNDVRPTSVPDNYTVIDRNIQGPRGRYGRFSYAITTRVPNENEPGKITLAGAMITDKNAKSSYPLEVVLMGAMPKVFTKVGNKTEWAWLTHHDKNAVIMGRGYSAISSEYGLQTFGSSSKGKEIPWTGCQEWICIKDRMIGLLEVAPKGAQNAIDVSTNFLFGTGGTAGGPEQPKTNIDPLTYKYGEMLLKVHETSFKTHSAIETKIRVKKGYEIVFRDSTSQNTISKRFNPDFSRYCLVEIKPEWSNGDLQAKRLSQVNGVSGLEVRYQNSVWTLYHNRSKETLKIDLPKTRKGQTTTLHTETGISVVSSTSYNLLPDARVLVVTSADPINHEKGWDNIEQMLKKN